MSGLLGRRLGNRGRRILPWPAALALAVFCGPALADTIYTNIGTIYPDSLAILFPSMVYRPIDDLGPRPGGAALGMGDAYLARAEGTMAIGWDPAGLATLDRPQAVVDGFGFSSSGRVASFPDSFDLQGIGNLFINSYNSRLKGNVGANFLAAGVPIWRTATTGLVGAVSWRRYDDVSMPSEVVSNMSIRGQQNVRGVVFSMDRSEKGAVESFAPSLAFQALPGFSVGANLNFLSGRLNSDLDQRVSAGGPPTVSTVSLSYKYRGFVPDFGVRLWGLENRIQVGARFSPAYILKVTDGSFTANTPLATDPTSRHVVTGHIESYHMKIPSSLGVGIAVQPASRLLVSFDFNRHQWSQTQFTFDNPSPRLDASGKLPLPLVDVGSLHFGAEYVLMRRAWGDFPVRAGFKRVPMSYRQVSPADVAVYYDTLGVDPLRLQVNHLEPGSSWNGVQLKPDIYTFGASLRMRGISYDLGIETFSYTEPQWFFQVPYDPTVNPGMEQVDVKQRITRFQLSGTYTF